MKTVRGTWLHGPALKILLKFGGLRPGDFVKLGGWVPHGEARTTIVLSVWHRTQLVSVLVGDLYMSYHYENVRAWMRPPLDLEL